ncbi:hypothetical protein AVEN_84091-1 [Araneus ventricosus]|uniref:Uncharacterized protein n=1 Tax=Araneus ventricosus TaxID=182803 RepID=A0A4Y2J7L8_ARAVE|nr:hypothetical protein AVEN_84091-1 [Araneus ventricosus]
MRACWQNTAGHWYEKLLLHGTRGKQAPDEGPSSKMASAIERPFIETRSHNDRPMTGFLSDSDGFSSGIAPKCLIGHRSVDHRYRMSFASRYDRKPSSVVSWR